MYGKLGVESRHFLAERLKHHSRKHTTVTYVIFFFSARISAWTLCKVVGNHVRTIPLMWMSTMSAPAVDANITKNSMGLFSKRSVVPCSSGVITPPVKKPDRTPCSKNHQKNENAIPKNVIHVRW